ncbi:hypothetical protein QTJ16_005925 [Diplocarpon rosae]|uniref:ER transporter 6TM N-terminal domain-containing protein n=1 Tax=Diplocarpon rosae TaxID=946125 RepID=A0AAD9SWD5_9HELO|nr:hypothetical protein QTJ16_005925 [Diplocarpon rosae]
MASSKHNGEDETPRLRFTAPSIGPRRQTSSLNTQSSASVPGLHRRQASYGSHHDGSTGLGKPGKQIRLEAPSGDPRSSASSIYMGSYSPRRSRGSHRSLAGSVSATPRASMSHSHLESLLHDLDLDLETYGVEEFRDGFFDASFLKPPTVNHEDLMRDAEYTLPAAFKKPNPLSPRAFFPRQWQGVKKVIKEVAATRAGIKLTKSFLAFFIAYVLCLIPVVRVWLGRYSYIMAISAIINHPGRTVGAQIDGAFSTIFGSATGLGWGAFALWISDSTSVARRGYGGILATFLLLFMGTIAAIRSYFARSYQLVICAGIAISYTCLSDTTEEVHWRKLYDFGIPWLCGQALCLFICCTIFPDAGARPLAVSLHNAFGVMQDGLVIPQSDPVMLHRKLAWTFVSLSQAHRDLILDISITRFEPSDIESLRNIMQGVIRSLLSLKMETQLFNKFEPDPVELPTAERRSRSSASSRQKVTHSNYDVRPDVELHFYTSAGSKETVIDIDSPVARPTINRTSTGERAIRLVASRLAAPTSKLLSCMRASLDRCDAVLMEMSGYRKYLGPPKTISVDILGSLTKLRKTMIKYDDEEESLMSNSALPPTYSDHPEVVELFLFVHPIRQAARTVESLLVEVMAMQQRCRGWRLYLPSYPLKKATQRTNAQVRHDRGGLTAGFYFQSQNQLARTMKGMTNVYKPLPRHQGHDHHRVEEREKEPARWADTMGKYEGEKEAAKDKTLQRSRKKRFRYRLWEAMHRLQGFETRFALKVAITTSLLSVPAWLDQSEGWWNRNESWWAVAMVWVMSHPRVGGNFQDLITRSFCAVLGAVWGGLAYEVYNGNPYIMALFAAIYMVPMIYRFTQSSHPRSGIVGCISFVVVSLSAKTNDGVQTSLHIVWTRGTAFVVGVVAAVVVNWILWPFVARHELRKALSSMMIYSSIIYRGVVAKYVYALTRHEIRLRGPFNPLPYSALIDSCENFFEYLVSVRQSSLFFHPHYMSDDEQAVESLLTYRRDAVAAVLMNLYILAGALRGDQKVPRYLPNAALARKRLLSHMATLEASQAAYASNNQQIETEDRESRKWSQVYSYSYSQSLMGCVHQLEKLQKYTKEIVGEQG